MNKPKSEIIRLLEAPDSFRATVNFTASRTAFPARLIEKDYFCSVLLEYLASTSEALVFSEGERLWPAGETKPNNGVSSAHF